MDSVIFSAKATEETLAKMASEFQSFSGFFSSKRINPLH